MNLIEYFKQGIRVLVLEYPDGSQVKYVTTLNRDILEGIGFPTDGKLYDLSSGKEIPSELLKYYKGVENKSEVVYASDLDKIFDKGAKLTW